MSKETIAQVLQEQLVIAKNQEQSAGAMVKTIETALSVLNGTHIRQFKLDKDDNTYQMFQRAQFVVKATSDEFHTLWAKYASESNDAKYKRRWVSDGGGPVETIGYVLDRPVILMITGVKIDNAYVLFVEPTSQLVDYQMVDSWIDTHFDGKYGGDRRAVLDVGNFHHIIHEIDAANVQAA